jgi:hypothetical protein
LNYRTCPVFGGQFKGRNHVLHLIRREPKDVLGLRNAPTLHETTAQFAQQRAQYRVAQADVGDGVLAHLRHRLPRLKRLIEGPATQPLEPGARGFDGLLAPGCRRALALVRVGALAAQVHLDRLQHRRGIVQRQQSGEVQIVDDVAVGIQVGLQAFAEIRE